MAEPPEFARYGEKCPRTSEDHLIGTVSGRCMHCNGKAVGWTWARVDAAQKARVALPIVTGPAPFAEQPETRNGLSPLPIAVPEGHRVETYFTNASINGEPQNAARVAAQQAQVTLPLVQFPALFADPPTICTIQGTGPCVYGSDFDPRCIWCKRDMRQQPPQSFQQVEADYRRAMLANPLRARLTCDRNGLEPGSWDREQELRAASNTVLDAANRHIAKLNERIAVLEADNKALKDRKDALIDQYSAASTAAMHNAGRFLHWRTRALQLAMQLATLKMAKPSPAMTLPEPEKPSQDVIWRNTTRFSR